MPRRPPKENLIPRRGQQGKPDPQKGAVQPRVPPPRPNPHPVRTPSGNQRGR
jgi:hypothetical protein